MTLNVLLFREAGLFVAQCLEYDIAAQGETQQKAMESFVRTFVGQIVIDVKYGKKILEGIQRAPKVYWDRFEEAEPLPRKKPIYMPKEVPSVRATAEFALADSYS